MIGKFSITTVLAVLGASACSAQVVSSPQVAARLMQNKAQYADLDTGENLAKRAAREGRDVSAAFNHTHSPGICSDCPPPDDFDHETIKMATRASDVVAIGKVVSQSSDLTPNGAFVFTDSEFVLSEVWKGSAPGVGLGKELTVTTPGGTVLSGTYHLSASVPGVASPVQGGTYLLFLKYLPESKSYKLVNPLGFLLASTVKPLDTQDGMPGSRFASQPTQFLEAMRSSVQRGMATAAVGGGK